MAFLDQVGRAIPFDEAGDEFQIGGLHPTRLVEGMPGPLGRALRARQVACTADLTACKA